MTFQADLQTDRDNVFLDTSGEGYAESVTYRVASTGATSTIKAIVEEQVFAIMDDKANKKFTISKGEVASPQRGDQITHGGEVWTILDVQEVVGMYELRCLKAQEVS